MFLNSITGVIKPLIYLLVLVVLKLVVSIEPLKKIVNQANEIVLLNFFDLKNFILISKESSKIMMIFFY